MPGKGLVDSFRCSDRTAFPPGRTEAQSRIMKAIAKHDSWRTVPMPPAFAVLDYTARFAPDEFEVLSRGVVPREMEDRWFIYFENDTLSLHRSWSGVCIYKVTIEREGEGGVVRTAIANRAPEQYSQTDDAYDARMLQFLIGSLLLGRDVPFPVPSDAPKASKALNKHHLAGSGFTGATVSKKAWWKFWK
jgi:hypothetical protein